VSAGVFRRVVPAFEMAPREHLEAIEAQAFRILEEIGIEFRYAPALETWRAAGAEVEGQRVRIPRELLMSQVALAPEHFVHHARNPERSVGIGRDEVAYVPVYGPPFVLDFDGSRRYAALDDLVRHEHDAPSVGLVLCKGKNRTIAEYALRDMTKPIGVAEYRLTHTLPGNLAEALPDPADLERLMEDEPRESAEGEGDD